MRVTFPGLLQADCYVQPLLKKKLGTSLAVQWLRLPHAEDVGSIPGCGPKILHALQPKKKTQKNPIKQKQYWNKFNKDF